MNSESDSNLSDIEDLVRHSAPRKLPQDLRNSIIAGMTIQTPVVRHSFRRYRWLAAAAVLILGGLLALLVRPEPLLDNVTHIPVKRTSDDAQPCAVITSKVGSVPIGQVINVRGRPLQLVKSYELATRAYEEPETGTLVNISYPQTRYQLVTAPIQ